MTAISSNSFLKGINDGARTPRTASGINGEWFRTGATIQMTNAIYDVAEGQVGELDNPLFIEVGCLDTARGLVSDLDEGRKKLDNFRDALGELQKRWDNQFIPEDGGLPEKYLQRRFIIVLDGYVFDPRANRNNRFLLRIEPDALGAARRDLPYSRQSAFRKG